MTDARRQWRDHRNVQDPIFADDWLFRRRIAAEEMSGESKEAIASILEADAVA